ncbi:DNA-binding protein, partial [Escherichia coli]
MVSCAAKVHFKEQVYDMKSLTLFNQPIRIGEDGMICL